MNHYTQKHLYSVFQDVKHNIFIINGKFFYEKLVKYEGRLLINVH
jgi:hypothetical protein